MRAAEIKTGAAYVLVLVLTVETTFWGAFLSPLHHGRTAVPLGAAVALVSNLVLGTAGGRLLRGRPLGAGAPLALWLVIALLLGSNVRGDVVLTNTTSSLVYLAAGTVGGVLAFGLVRPRRRSSASPAEATGR